MKKTLVVLCSAIALVGCDQNRGGTGSETSTGIGTSPSRDTTYPSSRSTNAAGANSAPLTNSSSNTGLQPSESGANTAPK
ncbi:MAG TPA: hypothetical protein VK846_19285 [Candidatus Limnocylindria bacterium]|nr:hypothetical protein [Candidatus Limnocylindria bacterium]